jgi:hypothetical protein
MTIRNGDHRRRDDPEEVIRAPARVPAAAPAAAHEEKIERRREQRGPEQARPARQHRPEPADRADLRVVDIAEAVVLAPQALLGAQAVRDLARALARVPHRLPHLGVGHQRGPGVVSGGVRGGRRQRQRGR